jgi:hypothetical protein
METIELDLAEWPRELLEYLIKRSCEEQICINKVIANILEEYLKNSQ